MTRNERTYLPAGLHAVARLQDGQVVIYLDNNLDSYTAEQAAGAMTAAAVSNAWIEQPAAPVSEPRRRRHLWLVSAIVFCLMVALGGAVVAKGVALPAVNGYGVRVKRIAIEPHRLWPEAHPRSQVTRG